MDPCSEAGVCTIVLASHPAGGLGATNPDEGRTVRARVLSRSASNWATRASAVSRFESQMPIRHLQMCFGATESQFWDPTAEESEKAKQACMGWSREVRGRAHSAIRGSCSPAACVTDAAELPAAAAAGACLSPSVAARALRFVNRFKLSVILTIAALLGWRRAITIRRHFHGRAPHAARTARASEGPRGCLLRVHEGATPQPPRELVRGGRASP